MKKYRMLFIDDIRNPPDCVLQILIDNCDITIARSFAEAVELTLRNEPFDYWHLDNDLGPGKEVYDFVKFIANEHPDKWPRFTPYVHSANIVASENMRIFICNFERSLLKA